MNSSDWAGSGFLILDEMDVKLSFKHVHLGTQASVFQSEIYAIKKVAQEMQGMNPENKTIAIYSDSKSALSALKRHNVTSHVVHEAISALNLLGVNNKIELRWVKAHNEHEFNEEADRLAKLGAADFSGGKVDDAPRPSAKQQRAIIRSKFEIFWQSDWYYNQPCRQTKHFFPQIDRNFSKALCRGGRLQFSAVVQLVTGHNFWPRHNSIVRNNGVVVPDEATCRYCGNDEESSYHVLAVCPQFQALRRDIFESHELEIPFKMSAMKLIQFLKGANLIDFEIYFPIH